MTGFTTAVHHLSPELALLATALCILVLDITIAQKSKRIVPYVALIGVLVTLILTYTLWGTEQIVLRVLTYDSLTIFSYFFLLITLIGLITISIHYIRDASDNAPFYYALLLFNGLAALLLMASTNILMMMLCLEFLSLTSYVLTGFLHQDTRSTEAALKYLIYGSIISALMLYGISWLYGLTGETDYLKIAASLANPGLWFAGESFKPRLLLPVVIFISTGFAFKIAAAPFHQWAPDAYEGAPTPITALLATIPKIAGFTVLFRVSALLLPSTTAVGELWHFPLLAILSASAMLLGSFGGLLQTDVKRMMAYSGITQAGYALMGLAIGTLPGVEAQFIYLIAYVIAELSIFAIILNLNEPGGSVEITSYKGLSHRSPLLAVMTLIALLSLTGLPGTAGFIGKFTLFSACIESGYLWLAVVGVINTVISFAYYWKLIRAMWLEAAESLPPIQVIVTTMPVLITSTVAIVVLGFFPGAMLRVVQFALRHFG